MNYDLVERKNLSMRSFLSDAFFNCDREQVKALKELSDYRMEQAKRCIQSTKLLKLFYIVK